MNKKTFEETLPQGYRGAYHLNAKNVKVGVIFNLIATVIAVLLAALGAMLLFVLKIPLLDFGGAWAFLFPLVFLVGMLAYLVLHELVHGLAYKLLTRQKLTFGISWSCAFCGVPQIYTYRRTALIAVLAPFVLFSLLFLAIAAVLLFVSPLWYMLTVLLFAIHVGGCCGDLFVAGLLLFKYRSPKTLMRDTGPEQFFYLSE